MMRMKAAATAVTATTTENWLDPGEFGDLFFACFKMRKMIKPRVFSRKFRDFVPTPLTFIGTLV